MCGERSPALTIEFRDEECAAVLRRAVTEALRGLPSLARISSVPGRPLLLHAWDDTDGNDDLPLFVEDANPDALPLTIPAYDNKFHVLDDNITKVEAVQPSARPSLKCFNCDGLHSLRDCTQRKDFNKINQKKKEMKLKLTRYHADDQIQVGSKIPGRISKNLRRALGLNREQLPLHIYKMRLFGYPPGWLLHARVSHSGLALFDSHGVEVKDPEDEEGEHPESKDRYDIKKILSFPGFNTRPSSKYIDESEELGYPPLSKEHSKMAMLDKLAPIAAKAYRRKKMSETKIKQLPCDQQTQEDMDIDDDSDEFGDGETSESFIPPLPIETLPPLPPPEILPPPPPTELPPLPSSEVPQSTQNTQIENLYLSSLNENKIDESDPHCDLQTLMDLKQQKPTMTTVSEEKDVYLDNSDKIITNSISDTEHIHSPDLSKNLNSLKSGNVCESNPGTPVFDISPFSKLPSSNSFSKDIGSMLNFENLPNSIGKYEQMSGLIKKVREAVSKLQEYDV